MKYLNIRYGLWAQLSTLPKTVRAAVVIGFWWICIYVILRFIYPGIICSFINVLNFLLKGIYWVIIRFLEKILSGMSYVQRAEKLNRISAAGEKTSMKLCELKEKMAKKKIPFFKMLLIYGVIVLLIGLPDFLQDKIAEEYLPAFSIVSNWYGDWEYDKLEEAKGYAPLFKEREETIPETTEAAEQTEAVEEETQSQIRLTLSKKGRGGSNIREEASVKSKSIKVVSGDVQMIYMEEKDGWVRVLLEDGTEGWIKNSLVDGLSKD